MIKALTLSDFSPVVGSSFQLHTEPEISIQLELLEVVALRNKQSVQSERRDSNSEANAQDSEFSLLFKGPTDMPLPQQIYQLNHNELGELGIFLVPVACHADGMKYEAIFS
ncbi:MAG: hypothetical protein F6K16_42455 [Symploca sp. SIO2B6]|nr:hypothetical protein [Symploca sp. SIO2B6]